MFLSFYFLAISVLLLVIAFWDQFISCMNVAMIWIDSLINYLIEYYGR